MNLYIIPEPLFEKTTLFKDLLSGLKASQSQKKMNIIMDEANNDFFKRISADSGIAIFPATSQLWINSITEKITRYNIYPIFICPGVVDFSFPHSNFTLNYSESTYNICTYFNATGCKNTAFLGFNKNSSSDNLKLSGLKYANIQHCIFENNGNISKMLEAFIENSDKFDSVLSTNDYVTILLLKKCNKKIPFKIASFGNTMILKNLHHELIRITLNFFEAGKKAIELYPFILENKSVTLTLKIQNNILVNEKKLEFDTGKKHISINKNQTFDFYADKDVIKINKAELIIQNMTETDKKIIELLINNYTYEETADLCHIGVTTLKYRLNRLKNICLIDDNKELFDIYKNFIFT